jgi:YD repeat-containing protein
VGLFGLAVLLSAPAPAHADIGYVYDALGRLRAVVDPASDAAIYSYDAVGNLLSITRHPATQVDVLEFPATAAPGSVITVCGTGFDPTPGSNAVTINGVAATVTAVTGACLTVTVPGGATTGPIGVTSPNGSATSPTALTVQAAVGPPTVTSFTPTIATWGTSLGVTGTGFDPGAGRTQVRMARCWSWAGATPPAT